jgi:hypothetical protein
MTLAAPPGLRSLRESLRGVAAFSACMSLTQILCGGIEGRPPALAIYERERLVVVQPVLSRSPRAGGAELPSANGEAVVRAIAVGKPVIGIETG